MTLKYELIGVPNQRFSTAINGNSLELSFRTFRGIMYATIIIGQEVASAGNPCLPNAKIFPTSVERRIGASFFFRCSTDDYPSADTIESKECELCMEETR